MDYLVDDLCPDQEIDGQQLVVPGYFVNSTAPISIEDAARIPITDDTLPTISDVVECLYQNGQSDAEYLGLVVQIHGYNTGVKQTVENGEIKYGKDGIREGWQQVCRYINHDDAAINRNLNSFVYVGYRWPSESVPSNFKDAREALPVVLKGLFWGGLLFTLLGLLLLLRSPLFVILVILGVAMATIVASLFLLRIIVYFRDNYRANNFGVPDLVEFIRQLDQGLIKRTVIQPLFQQVETVLQAESNLKPELLRKAIRKTWEELETRPELLDQKDEAGFTLLLQQGHLKLLKQRSLATVSDQTWQNIFRAFVAADQPKTDYPAAETFWNQRRIRLTFVGHSMGAFVTTQVVRILSDVFDPGAIGNLNSLEKKPPTDIGRTFCLGRLILLSPDIPVNTITSGRTNFLRSSLRRFEEAYLFSNEGDLALRLASTAANYFSFPTRKRIEGYRLGNVTVNLPGNRDAYGVINLDQLPGKQLNHLLQYIGVKALGRDEDKGLDPRRKKDEESIAAEQVDPESIADLFTYLDCTEYRDRTSYPGREGQQMNVLICEGQRSPLKFWNYLKLLKAYVDFSGNANQGRDVHGGYFYGDFSKLVIYRLAFLGFPGLLDSLISQSPRELGIDQLPPVALQEKLAKVGKVGRRTQRKIALEYFSWICQQKLIQVAASPERYYVDVLAQDREQVRKGILTEETETDSESGT